MKSLGFEQGHSLDDYLIKYLHQRNGSRSRDAEIYEDELGDAPHLRARDEWMNDGQPIPIRNDRDFFDIQKKVWGTVKAHIHCCYSVDELIKEGYEVKNNIEKAYDFGASEFNREMKRITQDRLKRGLPVSLDIPSDATLEELEELKAFDAWTRDGQPVED